MDWNELESRKAETGFLHCFTAHQGQRIIGTAGYLRCGDLFRLKNLFVHPSHRGKGMATQIVQSMRAMARSLEARTFCTMAVDNGPAVRMYLRCGLQIVGAQVEWL
jgi:GNAT superfamily N-acetyltransferase